MPGLYIQALKYRKGKESEVAANFCSAQMTATRFPLNNRNACMCSTQHPPRYPVDNIGAYLIGAPARRRKHNVIALSGAGPELGKRQRPR